MKLESYTIKMKTGHIECRFEKPEGGYHRTVIQPADDKTAKKVGIEDAANLIWTDSLRKRVAKEKKEAKEKQTARVKAEKEADEKFAKAEKAKFDKAVKDAVTAL